MFRIKYWEGPKIVSEILDASTYEIDDGMFDLLDIEGNVVLSVRRSSIISAVRLSALVGEVKTNGKLKTPANGNADIRPIRESNGPD